MSEPEVPVEDDVDFDEADFADEAADTPPAYANESDAAARIRQARKRAGIGGAVLAGAMNALQGVFETPKREKIAVMAEAPTEPINPDTEGIALDLDQLRFYAPPQRQSAPPPKRARSWGSRR